MEIFFDGKVEKGQLILFDSEGFKKFFRQFEGMSVHVWLDKAKRKRTLAQNRYLWGVAYNVISDALGWDVDDVHEFCKKEFNPKFITLVNLKTGESTEKLISGSTAKMTTIQFMEYVQKIQRFFAEHGVIVPDPNQVDFLEDAA